MQGEQIWQPAAGENDIAGEATVSVVDDMLLPRMPDGPVCAIGPDQVFDVPRRVWLPLPQWVEPGRAEIYYARCNDYGITWHCGSSVEGWLVSDTMSFIESGGVTYVGVDVSHAGLVYAGAPWEHAAAGVRANARIGDLLLLAMIVLALTMPRRPARKTQ